MARAFVNRRAARSLLCRESTPPAPAGGVMLRLPATFPAWRAYLLSIRDDTRMFDLFL
jgi:hypothetical protein